MKRYGAGFCPLSLSGHAGSLGMRLGDDMIMYCLTFPRPTRIGLNLFEVVGPFETTAAAIAWFKDNIRDARYAEGVLIQSIYVPTLEEQH